MNLTSDATGDPPVGPGTARIVQQIKNRAFLTNWEVGNYVGVHENSISRWLNSHTTPRSDNLNRLLEVAYIIRDLSRVYRPDELRQWLNTPQRGMDFDRPADLLDAGETRKIKAAIELITTGAYV